MSITIAVIGATGTAGSQVVRKLTEAGIPPVQISRSRGVDLVSGHGLVEALAGAHVVMDASDAVPTDSSMSVHETLRLTSRNVVEACRIQGVSRLAHLSLSAAHRPALDVVPYFAAKRAQEHIVTNSDVPSTVLRSTQWFEFALHPSAVHSGPEFVVAENWLIQPVAVESVAEVFIEHALLPEPPAVTTVGGPEVMRLPDLTAQLLERLGDSRPVYAKSPRVEALAEGDLIAPPHAHCLAPELSTWLARQQLPPRAPRTKGDAA